MPESNSTERWLPVVGYERFYDVSSVGRIRKADGRMLKPYVTKCLRGGYATINLHRGDGILRQFKVHRLVLIAFVGPPPPDRQQCNHRNGVKTDNRVENLEWCNNSENQRHAYRHIGAQPRRRGQAAGNSKLTNEQAREIRRRHAAGEQQKALAVEFGVRPGNVWFIVHRVTFQDV